MAMGLRNSPVPNRWPARFVSVASTANVVASTLNANFSIISQSEADARSHGKRAMVHSIVYRVTVAGPAGNGAYEATLLANVLECLDVVYTSSNLTTFGAPIQATLLRLDLAGRIAGDGYCDEVLNALPGDVATSPVVYGSDASALSQEGEFASNATGCSALETDLWGTSSRLVTVATPGGGAFERTYDVVIPACVKSATPGFGTLQTDVLPLACFTDTAASLVISVSNSKLISTALVLPAGYTVGVEVGCIVTYQEQSDATIFGTHWGMIPCAGDITGGTFSQDLYRAIFASHVPLNVPIADGGIGISYQPTNWALTTSPLSDGATLLLKDGNDVIFPGTSDNALSTILSAFNSQRLNGTGRKLRFQSNGASTIRPAGSAIVPAGPHVDDNVMSGLRGIATNAPVFPLLFSDPGAKGFGMCAMGFPGGASGASLKAQIAGYLFDAAVVSQFRAIVMGGGANAVRNRQTLACYSSTGDASGPARAFTPMTGASKTGNANAFALVVPWCSS